MLSREVKSALRILKSAKMYSAPNYNSRNVSVSRSRNQNTLFRLSKLAQLTSRLSSKHKTKDDYVLFRKCAAVNCDDLLEGRLFKFSQKDNNPIQCLLSANYFKASRVKCARGIIIIITHHIMPLDRIFAK